MSIARTVTAAAASTVIAAILAAGLATPAAAAPLPSPSAPIAPVGTGPSLTPVDLRPLFTIPSCTDMATARSISVTAARYPGFGLVTTPAGSYGTDAARLQRIIVADAGVTCAYGTGSTPTVLITETRITAADYKILKDWYRTNASFSHAGGGPVYGGGTTDTHYAVGTIPGGGPREWASISPNGWWITVKDTGIGALPYFEMDAVERFFQLNPRLALVTH